MTFSLTNAAKDIKNDELKRRLLESITQENADFSALAEQFYNNYDQTDEDYVATLESIVATVERVLAAGDWDESLFLHNTVKPLKVLREQAKAMINHLQDGSSSAHEELQLGENAVAVYVSLFQSDGHDMQKWQKQLQNLARYMLGRPIYENEADVQKLIRLKTAKIPEAYAKVAVEKSKIGNNGLGLKRTDRHGSALLNIAPGVIRPENIVEFVHLGKSYHYRDGKLILRG